MESTLIDRMAARRSILLAGLTIACSSEPQAVTDRVVCEAEVLGAPYPPSSAIRGIDVDFSSHRREARESDNWPLTWADDGHQYTSWGDGFGFERGVEEKVGLGYSRIEGGPSDYTGHDVFYGVVQGRDNPFRGKSYGILALQGRLYSWISPGSDRRNWEWTRLFESTDGGRSWEPVGVEFTQDEGLGLPWFLQAGRDYGAAEDGFVYVYFVEIKDGEWEAQRPGELALARVPASEIEDRGRYEFFAGLTASGAAWTGDPGQRRPVLADPNGLMRGSTVYNPGLDRYLTVVNHTARNLGNLAIFDAAAPWGPWTSVLYLNGWGGPGVPANTFYWNFSPKWFGPDGRGFVLVFTGKDENDSWNSVRGSFLLCAD